VLLDYRRGVVCWVALQDAEPVPAEIGDRVQVQHFPDGGIDWRSWPTNTDVMFQVHSENRGRLAGLEVPAGFSPLLAECKRVIRLAD
jgi:hypothetical protein